MVTQSHGSKGLSGEDQRYFPRWEVRNRVFYQLEDQGDVLQGQTKDISCAGACISVDGPVSSRKIKLTVFLSKDTSVELEGDVLWCRPAKNETQVGVSFQNTRPEVQDLILQYAFEVDRSNVVNNWFKGWDQEQDQE